MGPDVMVQRVTSLAGIADCLGLDSIWWLVAILVSIYIRTVEIAADALDPTSPNTNGYKERLDVDTAWGVR